MTVLSRNAIEDIVRNVENIKRIFFDIGTRVVKVAYISSFKNTRTTLDGKIVFAGKETDRLHCIQVACTDFPQLLEYITQSGNLKTTKIVYTCATQNESVENLIRQKFNSTLERIDVGACIVSGTDFLLKNIEAEAYNYNHGGGTTYEFKTSHPDLIYPYLVVNVGTGVSIMRVNDANHFERIGGSSIGGGTFIGMSNLLVGENDTETLIKMAERGNHRRFDLIVADIYGDKYEKLGLSPDLIAASFGKVLKVKNMSEDKTKLTEDQRNDIIRSLLFMIMNNIGQMAWLYSHKENVQNIYFNGFLIRNHPIVMRAITYAIDFWSRGRQKACFLRHESYTSVIGAFVLGAQPKSHWWREYYTGSTAMGRFVPTAPLSEGFAARTLELECTEFSTEPFPLLADKNYIPDEVNLNGDKEALEFWLGIMETSVNKVSEMAVKSQVQSEHAFERASKFRKSFISKLRIIEEEPFAYGNANVRNLLELREQILNENKFDDSYLAQKSLENNVALEKLTEVLQFIDSIKDPRERLVRVCRGLLAGNVFDWGASKVVEMMERHGGLSFDDCLVEIPDRPWLYDGLDEFISKIETYRCAAIFVDNSGGDFLLGVVPFVRELANHGIKVIVISNYSPALNDLTVDEMLELVPHMSVFDSQLGNHISNGNIMFTHHGQGSPCLDFRKIHSDLNQLIIDNKVDLVIIEGMGRSLHTNFSAKFTCDSLKVAVIKTQWLADRMGGQLFSVVFRFEEPDKLIENNESSQTNTGEMSGPEFRTI